MSEALERRTVSKITWRLLPYLFVLYLVSYIDRINISVAQLQMPRDVPMNSAAWGFGAGLFFVGYFLFEVPSNMILARVGARIWIARIMLIWGVISSSMMFAKTVPVFYALRFLLGAAEAGFFPGILYYLTRWFRERDRARAVALFMTAGTMANAIGSLLSGALLELDGWGDLHGWQWVFLLEGIPAVLLGVSVLFVMIERPSDAPWLTTEEKNWIEGELERERAAKAVGTRSGLMQALTDPRVLLLTLVYFLLVTGAWGFELWLPRIVKPLVGGGYFRTTLFSAIPSLIAAVVQVIVGAASDRWGERRWVVAGCTFVSMIGFLVSAMGGGLVWGLAALSLAWCGIKSAQGPFWALSASSLSASSAAAGLALINSIANLGGQLGPWAVGWLEQKTGSFSTGFFLSAFLLGGSGLVVLQVRPKAATSGTPQPPP
jgi:ACS family tartrate transporter-like MFS transporter